MKLSDLLFKAIPILREFPRSGPYFPYHVTWHRPSDENPDEISFACLAGLYAAALDWVKPFQEIWTETEPTGEQRDILHALDDSRCGHYQSAQRCLGIPLEERIPLEESPDSPEEPHFKGWDEFDRHLDSLEKRARQLKAKGH